MATVIDILKKELIGKPFRMRISCEPVYQEYTVYKKKSNNVTDKQFDNGANPKFRMVVNRKKKIGSHMIFEDTFIKDVYLENHDYEGYDIMIELGNGMIRGLWPEYEIADGYFNHIKNN